MFKNIAKPFVNNNIFAYIIIYVFSVILANIMYILGYNPLGIQTVLWSLCLFLLFGFLILSLSGISKKMSFTESLGYGMGFSILAIILLGLIVNSFGLVLNIATLRSFILVPVFDVSYVSLAILNFLKYKGNDYLTSRLLRLKISQALICVPAIALPFLSIIGAVRLNNTGSNWLAVLSLCVTLLYALIIIVYKHNIPSWFYAISLWSISSALLLGFSMRSNYLYGFDIHQEFAVFTNTLKGGLWHPSKINVAYNACLSITILPTFISSFLHIQSQYIFKFISPLIFSTLAIIIYNLFYYQLKNKKQAFLLAFFFITQTQFISEFPFLIRQQFALIFFTLMFSATFLNVSVRTRKILILSFGLGMILSHYSTAYVCLAILIVAYLFKLIYILFRKDKKDNPKRGDNGWSIKPSLIIVLLLSSFLWYGLVSNISSGLKSAIESSLTSFNSFFEVGSRSDFVLNTIGINNSSVNNSSLIKLSKSRKVSNSYNIQDNSPRLISVYDPAPQNNTEHALSELFNLIIPLLIKLLLVTGIVYTLYLAFVRKKITNFVSLIFSASLLFVAIVALPNISQYYNVERFYQQILLIVSPMLFVGLSFIIISTKKINSRAVTSISSVIIFSYAVCTTGLALEATYGSPYIDISNNNSSFAHYYTRDGEIDSLNWLASNRQKFKGIPDQINFDRYSDLNAIAYDSSLTNNAVVGILPTQITKDGYIYASTMNLKGYVFDSDQNNVITYNFPFSLLNENKNIIYNSGDSEIYQ